MLVNTFQKLKGEERVLSIKGKAYVLEEYLTFAGSRLLVMKRILKNLSATIN
jgi:hypothetical protein